MSSHFTVSADNANATPSRSSKRKADGPTSNTSALDGNKERKLNDGTGKDISNSTQNNDYIKLLASSTINSWQSELKRATATFGPLEAQKMILDSTLTSLHNAALWMKQEIMLWKTAISSNGAILPDPAKDPTWIKLSRMLSTMEKMQNDLSFLNTQRHTSGTMQVSTSSSPYLSTVHQDLSPKSTTGKDRLELARPKPLKTSFAKTRPCMSIKTHPNGTGLTTTKQKTNGGKATMVIESSSGMTSKVTTPSTVCCAFCLLTHSNSTLKAPTPGSEPTSSSLPRTTTSVTCTVPDSSTTPGCDVSMTSAQDLLCLTENPDELMKDTQTWNDTGAESQLPEPICSPGSPLSPWTTAHADDLQALYDRDNSPRSHSPVPTPVNMMTPTLMNNHYPSDPASWTSTPKTHNPCPDLGAYQTGNRPYFTCVTEGAPQ